MDAQAVMEWLREVQDEDAAVRFRAAETRARRDRARGEGTRRQEQDNGRGDCRNAGSPADNRE